MKRKSSWERFERWRELFMSAWRVKVVVLHTYRSPDGCASRLRSGIGSIWRWRGPHPVVGRVRSRSFTLKMREPSEDELKSFVHVAGFHTVVRGRLVASGSGTRIMLKSSTSLAERVFMTYGFGFVALWWAAAIYGAMTKDEPGFMFMIFLPPFFIAAFVAQAIYGRWRARDEHEALMTFLQNRLDARPC